jgi:hypothetical protein
MRENGATARYNRPVFTAGSGRGQKPRHFCPALDCLEDRNVPSTVWVEAVHVLHIQGTEGPGRVAITDDGRGGIALNLDDRLAVTFTGIDQIDLNTGAGNDVVTYQYGDPVQIGNPELHPADLRMDLGGGDDQLTLAAFNPVALAATHPWHVAINTGAGNDQVTVEVSHLTMVAAPTGRQPDAFSLRVGGGDGDDRINVRVDAPDYVGPAILGVAVAGGRGNNLIDVESTNPEGDLYGVDRAQCNLKVTGGGGQDRIHVLVGSLNQGPDPELHLDWNIMASGGAGNDVINVEARDVLLTAGTTFRLRVDGGAGDDVLRAVLSLAPQSRGTVDAQMLGGPGDDDLTLDVFCPDDNTVAALIDGGPGFDTAHHTDNVRVLNCEP